LHDKRLGVRREIMQKRGKYLARRNLCPVISSPGGNDWRARENFGKQKKREIPQLLTGTFVRVQALGARSSYYAHLSYEPRRRQEKHSITCFTTNTAAVATGCDPNKQKTLRDLPAAIAALLQPLLRLLCGPQPRQLRPRGPACCRDGGIE